MQTSPASAIGHHKFTPTLLRSAIVAAIGGLLFGFDTAVIAGTTQALTDVYHLTPGTLGLTVSIALVGTIVGAATAGAIGDKYGRRDSLRGLAVLYLISALGCAMAANWTMLVVFRFLTGLAIGGSSVLGPMYIAEVSPARWRGRLVGLFQFCVVSGILLAYFSNYAVGLQHFGDAEWRVKFGVAAVPAFIFLLCCSPFLGVRAGWQSRVVRTRRARCCRRPANLIRRPVARDRSLD